MAELISSLMQLLIGDHESHSPPGVQGYALWAILAAFCMDYRPCSDPFANLVQNAALLRGWVEEMQLHCCTPCNHQCGTEAIRELGRARGTPPDVPNTMSLPFPQARVETTDAQAERPATPMVYTPLGKGGVAWTLDTKFHTWGPAPNGAMYSDWLLHVLPVT